MIITILKQFLIKLTTNIIFYLIITGINKLNNNIIVRVNGLIKNSIGIMINLFNED